MKTWPDNVICDSNHNAARIFLIIMLTSVIWVKRHQALSYEGNREFSCIRRPDRDYLAILGRGLRAFPIGKISKIWEIFRTFKVDGVFQLT